MPGVTPLRPDDVRSARAWAAFVADDAAAGAPPSLEARVMRAAQAAMAQQRQERAEAERAHRHWFGAITAIAASLLAAAAWSLAPGGLAPSRVVAPPDAPRAGATPAPAAATVSSQSSAPMIDEPAGRPVPMTNIEAGRVLATPPASLLASRPLFDPADGVGPVRAPGTVRGKSYGAPTVEPAFTNGRPTHSIAAPVAVAAAPAAPSTTGGRPRRRHRARGVVVAELQGGLRSAGRRDAGTGADPARSDDADNADAGPGRRSTGAADVEVSAAIDQSFRSVTAGSMRRARHAVGTLASTAIDSSRATDGSSDVAASGDTP